MKTKLTLRLDKLVFQVVEKFFRVLSEEKEEVTPAVRKLKGLLKDSNIDENDFRV